MAYRGSPAPGGQCLHRRPPRISTPIGLHGWRPPPLGAPFGKQKRFGPGKKSTCSINLCSRPRPGECPYLAFTSNIAHLVTSRIFTDVSHHMWNLHIHVLSYLLSFTCPYRTYTFTFAHRICFVTPPAKYKLRVYIFKQLLIYQCYSPNQER